MKHPTAVIHPDAILAADVVVGPFAVIEGAARIGAGCTIQAHAIVGAHVVMGERNPIGYGAIVGGDPQDFAFKTVVPRWIVQYSRMRLSLPMRTSLFTAVLNAKSCGSPPMIAP